MHRLLLSLSVATVVLAGCGNNLGEQALFGAGAGALGSAAVGGDPLLGAAVGAGGNILICQTNQRNCRR